MGGERTSHFTGVAGVHFVASVLAYLGFHAVPTTRNVAGPNLLICTLNGAKRGVMEAEFKEGHGHCKHGFQQ